MVELSENSIELLKKRYLLKDENENILETPEQLFRKISKIVASVEIDKEKYEENFYNIMNELLFLPSTPILANIGNKNACLSACFVLGIEDNMESIFNTLKNTAIIFKNGGGVGINFSKLRPENDIISTTRGRSSGVLSFMSLFDKVIDVVKQGGIRRGAMMGVLSVYHPDIEKFIKSKINNVSGEKIFTNMNISVLIDDNFIRKYFNDEKIKLVNPRTNECVKEVKAIKIFNDIVESSWLCGDPGILFYDRLNYSNYVEDEKIMCVNPCGEQPLFVNESCNLGSLNLEKFVKVNNYKILEINKENCMNVLENFINFDKLEYTIRNAIRFLDDVIDINNYVFKEIEKKTKSYRKIGLGVMGFANMLYRLFIPYSDPMACVVAEEIMNFIYTISKDESIKIALEKGTFPEHDNTLCRDYIRNANILTIAPTGSISQIADTSSGIEPNFYLFYSRNGLRYINKPLIEYLKYKYNDNKVVYSIVNKMINNDYSMLDEYERKVFVTSLQINPSIHIKIQESFQKYIDNAISKTINLPQNATRDDIISIFHMAFESNIKGITIFRDKSLPSQVVETLSNKCEICGGNMFFDGKCYKCISCGYSNLCQI
jgi:ribonucleoside-diphosphate reductase alpha chain